MTEISQDDLKTIIDHQKETDRKLEILSKENKELRGLTSEKGIKKLKEITEKFAEVRMIDSRVIIGFKNRGTERRPSYIYEKQDKQNLSKQIDYVDVILEATDKEEEEVMSIIYQEFLEGSERVRAKIVNIKKNDWVISHGSTRRKQVDGYSLIELDFLVDMEVKGTTRDYTLRLPEEFNNREVTVYEDYINI